MPGLFDLPREQLFSYAGRNPRPADFDAYWDQALAESRARPLEIELRPNPTLSSRAAECFDLTFAGVDGARIHAKYARPRGIAAPAPTILEFHGYSGDSGDWAHRLGWISEGFCVAALDCRGQAVSRRISAACAATPCAGTSSAARRIPIPRGCFTGRFSSIPRASPQP